VDGLCQYFEVVAFFARGLQQVARLSLTRKEHDLAGRTLFPQANSEFDPGQSRHYHVRYDEVRSDPSSSFQSLQWVNEATSLIATELQNSSRGGRDDSIVVNDKNMFDQAWRYLFERCDYGAFLGRSVGLRSSAK
jgi:hypothetical protein